MFSIYVKTLSDSTLMQMKKKDLIEYVRICERNLANAYATLDQQAENFKKLLDEQERPKGRWIETTKLFLNGQEAKFGTCSSCYESWFLGEDEDYLFEEISEMWDFCPNCGADMRESEQHV